MRVCETIKEKISVIVPVYNAEEYLENTFNDLIGQSYKNMEIIVIDDGSTDSSREIIERYKEQDKRFIVIEGNRKGPSKARNMGLEVATGDYIRFVDADDRMHSNSMNYLLEAYKKDMSIDLVIGNFSTDERKDYFTGKELREAPIQAKDFAEIFISHVKSFYFGVPWNKLYKRSIIERNHIRFNESIIWCEDFLFNVEYYSKCKMIYLVNRLEGVYQYCTRETGITSNIKYRGIEEINAINTLRYNAMKKYCINYGLLDRFELEWKYADLYEKLSNTTKYLRNDYIWIKYRKFKEYMNEEETYQYISIKWDKTKAVVWKLLKEAKEKDSYLKVFLYFVFKGFQYRYIKNISLNVEKETQDKEITLL